MRLKRVEVTQAVCGSFLALLFLCSAAAEWTSPYAPDEQFRRAAGSLPSRDFPLGTDDLGRDRLSRLIHASRISMLFAPAASMLSVFCAAFIGAIAAARPGLLDRSLMAAADMTLSLPWLMLLLTIRAMLPLEVSPWASLAVTFALLGCLGWAGPARVVRATVSGILQSNYVLAARARGLGSFRILVRHVLPGTRHVLAAQFGSTVPVFILAEANLSFLGLGVTEPAASWGTMLKEIESMIAGGQPVLHHYWILAPVALVIMTVLAWTILFPSRLTT